MDRVITLRDREIEIEGGKKSVESGSLFILSPEAHLTSAH